MEKKVSIQMNEWMNESIQWDLIRLETTKLIIIAIYNYCIGPIGFILFLMCKFYFPNELTGNKKQQQQLSTG